MGVLERSLNLFMLVFLHVLRANLYGCVGPFFVNPDVIWREPWEKGELFAMADFWFT